MNATSFAELSSKALTDSSTTQQLPLGTLMYTRDGRGFRYCKNGAVLMVAGNQIQTAIQKTTYQNMTPTAASVGAIQVSMTPGALAAVANLYQDGVVQVDTTPDIGSQYLIASHLAIGSSTIFTLNLYSDEGLRVAWTSSTRVGCIENPYANVLQSPTTATGVIVGAAIYAIPASTATVFQFGWVQTHGIANVLIAGTPAVGIGVGYSATAGAAAVLGATLFQTGGMMVTGQAGLCQSVFLTID
jgi:hypothetical protein